MIPIKYNLRSLSVRWVTTLMTVLAMALVVFISVLTLGGIVGIFNAFSSSADEEDLIVMRQGSPDELSSTISSDVARELMNSEGVTTDSEGEPIAAREVVTLIIQKRKGENKTANIVVRGTETASRTMRPDFKIIEGKDLEPGLNQIITSRKMAQRFDGVNLGDKVEINKTDFEVVGIFEAGGSSAESELWADLRDLGAAQGFAGAVSVVNLRVPDEKDREDLVERIRTNEQFKLDAKSEEEYFKSLQTSTTGGLIALGVIVSFFMIIGACFAAANTMYAAVASRGREIGTLRALGFSRRTVLMSFIAESVVICLLGGLLGCLATLPLHGKTGGTQASTFSEVAFSLDFGPLVLAAGMFMALLMGLVGGVFPAFKAIRLQIVNALRER